MEEKQLDLNRDKSCFLIVGSSKGRKKLQMEVNKSPLLLYGDKMKQVTVEKYLGFYLSTTAGGSVAATVAKRLGIATRAVYEARAVVEDSRAESVGGLVVMFNIMEMAIRPMLYYGCSNWSPLPKKTLKKLNKFTITYLRVALGLGKKGGCPLPSLYWQTGTMLPENFILYQKLLFIHHLATLPDGSLAKDSYLAQKIKQYPGIVTQCEEFLNKWNISSIEQFTKYQ